MIGTSNSLLDPGDSDIYIEVTGDWLMTEPSKHSNIGIKQTLQIIL